MILPKLANVRLQWGQQGGRPALFIQNALGFTSAAVALPAALSMLPALCDGTRDVSALRAALMVRAGVRISEQMLAQILEQMDEALLFENGRQGQVLAEALERYRQAPTRPPVSAGLSYPADAVALRQFLETFATTVPAPPAWTHPPEDIRGIVSPHIDYERGGVVYAQVWSAARAALERAALVVILGTDHHGPAGSITLTRQDYATPLGVLPTDREALERMARAIGEEIAFAHEYHHAVEHSVELAAVWLQYVAPAARPSILPIICGSFEPFIAGQEDPDQHPVIGAAVSELGRLTEDRGRVVFVAAADFAHMGPAFNGAPVGLMERGRCAGADNELLEAICAGSAEGFLKRVRAESDRRNVCGVPPIYLMLRVLGPAKGLVTGVQQCPADGQGTSIVSIAGALLW